MGVGKSRDPRASRYSRLSVDKGPSAKASWEEADADALWRAVTAATDAGDAVMFGKTRDGGAVVLTVLSGDDRIRSYAHDASEIAELLKGLRAAAEDVE